MPTEDELDRVAMDKPPIRNTRGADKRQCVLVDRRTVREENTVEVQVQEDVDWEENLVVGVEAEAAKVCDVRGVDEGVGKEEMGELGGVEDVDVDEGLLEAAKKKLREEALEWGARGSERNEVGEVEDVAENDEKEVVVVSVEAKADKMVVTAPLQPYRRSSRQAVQATRLQESNVNGRDGENAQDDSFAEQDGQDEDRVDEEDDAREGEAADQGSEGNEEDEEEKEEKDEEEEVKANVKDARCGSRARTTVSDTRKVVMASSQTSLIKLMRCVCTCVYVFACLYVCVLVLVFLYVRACVCVFMRACTHRYVILCTCVPMCV